MATAQNIADRVREVLNDPDKVRWTDAELFRWIGDALDIIARHSPSLFVIRGSHTTTAGAKQTLTNARAISIVRVVGLTLFDNMALDAFLPTWQTGSSGTAQQWSPCDDPKSFYVYPPAASSATLTIDFVEAPGEITALSDNIPLSEDYVSLLSDYVTGMCEAKDSVLVDSGRAQAFLQSFMSKLNVNKG